MVVVFESLWVGVNYKFELVVVKFEKSWIELVYFRVCIGWYEGVFGK